MAATPGARAANRRSAQRVDAAVQSRIHSTQPSHCASHQRGHRAAGLRPFRGDDACPEPALRGSKEFRSLRKTAAAGRASAADLLRNLGAARRPEMTEKGLVATPLWYESTAIPVLPERALPSSVDVLIIGAGYTGLSAARETAAAGRSTLVLDAGTL